MLQRSQQLLSLDPDSSDSSEATPPKQQRLDFNRGTASQGKLDQAIARYVVENMQPISTVESPAFRHLVSMIPCPGGTRQMGRKTFSNYLERAYTKMENELKKRFEGLDYIYHRRHLVRPQQKLPRDNISLDKPHYFTTPESCIGL